MRTLRLGSVAIVMSGVIASAGMSGVHGTARAAAPSVSALEGTSGELDLVAAVPHSLDVWAVGDLEGLGTDHFFIGHRHDSHWQRVTTPNLGGESGELDAVAATTGRSVWIGGGKQSHTARETPVIFRWNGKKFLSSPLPKTVGGDVTVESISASSPSNAWAVGEFVSAALHTQVALHWNGKRWSSVPIPKGDGVGLRAVSTSGPNNAWALRSDGALVHWNGKVWAVDGTVPTGVQLIGIATSSPTLAYAVGSSVISNRFVILRFNGTSWSRASLAKGAPQRGQLIGVSMHGNAAWAVGTHNLADGEPHSVIMHSAGGVWTSQHTPGIFVSLNAISAQSATRAYSVGTSQASADKTFFYVYNGHWAGAPSEF